MDELWAELVSRSPKPRELADLFLEYRPWARNKDRKYRFLMRSYPGYGIIVNAYGSTGAQALAEALAKLDKRGTV
jgi:hypothetical protein